MGVTGAMAAISFIGLGAQLYNSSQQSANANKLANQQQQQEQTLETQAKQEQQNQEGAAIQTSMEQASKQKQMQLAGVNQGYGGTLLGSPMGQPGAAPGTGKTLLGM